MYFLTRTGEIESGAYASVDVEGTTVVQFFVDKDDAMVYNVQLEALGLNLHVTEIPDDKVSKICDALGHAYSICESGEIVVPRFETLQDVIVND